MPKRTRKAQPASHQCAAVCWREAGRGVEVLLITSRNTGRWVCPKGWLMRGKTSAESAAQEAWEEAGVKGIIRPTPLGQYSYCKSEIGKDLMIEVLVFSLEVTNLRKRYLEQGQRDRRWVAPDTAADLVQEKELSMILRSFMP